MGFTPEPTIYNLSFKGTPLDGLHIRIGCCTIAEFNWMLTLRPDRDKGETAVDTNRKVMELFLHYLDSWDLEDREGKPVPQTVDGIESQPAYFGAQIIAAWQTAMVAVSAPLEQPSSNGASSEEATLGLDSISGSLPS